MTITTDTSRFAALGTVEEIDTRTADIPTPILDALDDAVLHFATRQNKKQLRITSPDAATAELRESQIHRYAAATGVTLSSLTREGRVIEFRFAKTRPQADGTRIDDPDDGDDDAVAEAA